MVIEVEESHDPTVISLTNWSTLKSGAATQSEDRRGGVSAMTLPVGRKSLQGHSQSGGRAWDATPSRKEEPAKPLPVGSKSLRCHAQYEAEGPGDWWSLKDKNQGFQL